jgi:hypothetical protein
VKIARMVSLRSLIEAGASLLLNRSVKRSPEIVTSHQISVPLSIAVGGGVTGATYQGDVVSNI